MAIKDDRRRHLIARKLRGHRAEAGLTQEEVAERCGIDKTTLGKYELGQSCMSLETVWDLANLYGVSLDALGGREVA